MSIYCPGCGTKILDGERTSHYNGGYWHAYCAEKDLRNQMHSKEKQEQLARESAARQEQIARESAEWQEMYVRESTARQEQLAEQAKENTERAAQLAKQALQEQQRAKENAKRAELHAKKQKELVQDDVRYRNSLSAAKDGDIASMVYVAKAILDGQVVAYSISLAKEWLFKAFENNSLDALRTLYKIWNNLDQEEKRLTALNGQEILEKSNNACLQDYIDFLSILSDVGNIKTRVAFVNKHQNKFSNTKICPFCYKIIKPSQKTWHKTLIKDNLPTFRSFCSSECADKFYIETAIGRTEYENAKQIQFEKDHLRCEICKNYYPKNEGSFNKLVVSNLNTKHSFCSNKCRDEYYASKAGLEEIKKAEKKQLEKTNYKCEVCGNYYPKKTKSFSNKSVVLNLDVTHLFCSQKCCDEFYLSEAGKKELEKVNEIILERDYFKCEKCGNYYLKTNNIEQEQVAQLLGKHHKFCSKKCVDDYYLSNKEGIAELNEIKDHTYKCKACKNSFYALEMAEYCSDYCKKLHTKKKNIKRLIAASIVILLLVIYGHGAYTYKGNIVYNYIVSTINAKTANITQDFDFTFETRSSIESITIPEGITSIGAKTFYGFSSLKEVIIPDSVTYIDDSAFVGCESIHTVNANPKWSYLFKELSIEKWIIPDGVTTIKQSAFAQWKSLKSVSIPNSVTNIMYYAFLECTYLTSIAIPNSVTTIGASAFEGCRHLASVSISNSLTTIGMSAFKNCSSLTSMSIPNGVTIIEESTFEGCQNLASVSISNSLTTIGTSAFKNCVSLHDISALNRVTSIKDSAFEGCSKLQSITLPNTITSIGKFAFYNCNSLNAIYINKKKTAVTLGDNWKPSLTKDYWKGEY